MHNEHDKTSLIKAIILGVIISLTFSTALKYSISTPNSNPANTNNNSTNNVIAQTTAVAVANEIQKDQNIRCTTVSYYKAEPEIVEELTVNLELPDCDTSFKAYMDYQTITDTTTEQWKMQKTAYTDENGLRKIQNDYCVAIGSYYSETIGDRFEITLENGNVFTVIVSDFKKNEHTDDSNMYTPVIDENGNFHSANVLEFIVEENMLSDIVQLLGTVDGYDYFEGNIKSIRKINN